MNDHAGQNPADALAAAAGDAARTIREDAAEARDVVAEAAARAAVELAEIQRETLGVLRSLDDKLGKLPNYQRLLADETKDRKRGQRLDRMLGAAVLLLLLALGGVVWRVNQDRHESTRDTRCGIRHGFSVGFDEAAKKAPAHAAEIRALGDQILARVATDLPANCPNGG